MSLPSTTFLTVPVPFRLTPSPPFPEMMLAAASVVPPIVFFEAPAAMDRPVQRWAPGRCPRCRYR